MEDGDGARPWWGGLQFTLFCAAVTVVAYVVPSDLSSLQRVLVALLVIGFCLLIGVFDRHVGRWLGSIEHLRRRHPRATATIALIVMACSGIGLLGTTTDHSRHANARSASPGVTRSSETPVAASSEATINGVTATTGVADVSAGATKYSATARASYNDVIKVQLFISNGGRLASSVRATLTYTKRPGNPQSVSWQIGVGEGTAIIANALSLDGNDAYLGFIPGSAVWRHSARSAKSITVTTNTPLADSAVLTPSSDLATVERGDDQAMTVTALFGVYVPGVAIDITSKAANTSNWRSALAASPGETLPVKIMIKDTGNTAIDGVSAGAAVPPSAALRGSVSLVRQTGTKSATSSVSGIDASPVKDLPATSYEVGTLQPGEIVTLQMEVQVPSSCPQQMCVVWAFLIQPGKYYYNLLDIYLE